ncbi:nitrate reductase molybdenum cofactor assembly chaperone [Pseudomonas sp. NPDC089401]|uniref:nitrate reductase molybdenum cofactor assembly chaperone n=1 Tax=Pseudomonas sp. NPDC089401 TaxID=3364462 RepID=UPI003802D3C8
MQILKVLALLLDYPGQALILGQDALERAIDTTHEFDPAQRADLRELLEELTRDGIGEVQSRHQALFDQGGALSLRLFEQMQGAPCDQVWAMFGLLGRYEAAGFAFALYREPDYIPLYLEFLATCEEREARDGLADVAHLLALLAARLEVWGSRYAGCLRALLQIAGVDLGEVMEVARERVVGEARQDEVVGVALGV